MSPNSKPVPVGGNRGADSAIARRDGHFEWIAPYYDRLCGNGPTDGVMDGLRPQPGGWILDIGGGTGRVANAIAEVGAEVTVVDPSTAMTGVAKRKGISVVRASAEHLPFVDASADGIVIVDALHHFADQAAAAQEAVRVLRPGGNLVVHEPDIRRPEVKLAAALERLVRMQSTFMSPRDMATLFERFGARTRRITASGHSAQLDLSR